MRGYIICICSRSRFFKQIAAATLPDRAFKNIYSPNIRAQNRLHCIADCWLSIFSIENCIGCVSYSKLTDMYANFSLNDALRIQLLN